MASNISNDISASSVHLLSATGTNGEGETVRLDQSELSKAVQVNQPENEDYRPNHVEVEQLRKDIRRLQSELDEARSLVAVANYSLEESIETERRKCKEEVATLQQLMKESLQDAVHQTQERCDGEIRRLKNLVTRLELELHEIKTTDKDNPNVFSAVTKTLARKVGSLANPALALSPLTPTQIQANTSQSSEGAGDDYLEQSMKRAQEDVEVLRSLVLPLEEEIKALKDKLRTADDHLRTYEASQAALVRGTRLLDKMSEDQSLSTLVTQLSETDKEFLDGADQATRFDLYLAIVNAERTSLQDERERLRSQLQEACQLLESERRHHRELKRSIQKSNDPSQSSNNHSSQDPSRESHWERGNAKGNPIKDKLNLSPILNRISPVLKRRSPAHSPQRECVQDLVTNVNFPESAAGSKTITINEQCDASKDDSPMRNLIQKETVLASDCVTGHSSVSEKCVHCHQSEGEIQRLTNEKAQLEKQILKAREEVDRMSDLVKDMEHKWTEVAKDYEKQVTVLYGNIEDLQSKLKAMHLAFSKFRSEAQDTLRQMQFDRETVSSELVRLQEENDFLVGRHSAHAEQLQNEIINLPDNLQELQYVVLNLREDLIAAKVAKEAVEKKWQSEMQLLKDQLITEQQTKETLENSLSGEIDDLREQLGLIRSVHTQLDEESTRKASLEVALTQVKEQLAEAQERANEAVLAKNKADSELQQLRNRIGSLQSDLETSEAVQRDFVQLSQQLQVQLEKIRQSEKELRWQYEEDVDQCAHCRQAFTVTKRKHHCRHCGQIFCFDCLPKTVTSGPNKRQARVCNVCYYLLVQDSAPFFSSEPQPSNG